MLSLELPEDLESRLDALAKATGRTPASYAQEAIVEYLGDLEDLYLAQKPLSDLEAGRSTVISLDEVVKRHGLDD